MIITIIDLDLGNIGSIVNMLKHIGHASRLVTHPDDLQGSEKIILSGVGSFDACMKKIDVSGWRAAIEDVVIKKKTPILGICLGMHILCNASEEGKLAGLGLIDGACVKFSLAENLNIRVPHMGWNKVTLNGTCPLFNGLDDKNKFYFTHSYYLKLNALSACVGTTVYGTEFVSSIAKGNIFGVQFHPEKSHKYGKQLFDNFVKL